MRLKVVLILIGLLMVMSTVSAQPWEKGSKMAKEVVGNAQEKQAQEQQDTQTQKNQKQAKLEEIKEKIKERREKYKNFAENYTNAKKKFEEAKKSYFVKKGFNNTKKYLYHWADMAENWMEKLRNKIQHSKMSEEEKNKLLSQLDDYIAIIDESKQKVENAGNATELRIAAREMKQNWLEIRKGVRAIVGQVIIGEMNIIAQNAEQVQVRLEMRIEEMKQAGIDTQDIEKTLNEFSTNIELAKENLEKAREELKSNNLERGYAYIRDAKKNFKDAFECVKRMVMQLRVKTGVVFYGNETGEVWAAGNGSAILEGSVVGLVKGDGTIKVTPKEAVISAVGFGGKEVDNNSVVYTGSGKVNFRGKDIKVEIYGENIRLFAKGYGSLTLEGTGVCRVKKLPKEMMGEVVNYSNQTVVTFGEG